MEAHAEEIKNIHGRLTVLETRSAVDDVHRGNIIARLSSIEDTLKWLVRLVAGGIIAGVIAFIISGGIAI